jgi:signal peptidase I
VSGSVIDVTSVLEVVDGAPIPARDAASAPALNAVTKRSRRRSASAVAFEWLVIVALALSVALLVRATVVQTFYIPTVSMVPTLKVDDRLLVDKVTLQTREIRRGDIIVFKRPASFTDKTVKDLIKRVIGLPGDTVEGRGGAVWVNGKQLPERYLQPNVKTTDFDPVRVGVDNYFVMGDNRPESFDSRFWGTVEREQIIGRALVRIWPLGRLGRI